MSSEIPPDLQGVGFMASSVLRRRRPFPFLKVRYQMEGVAFYYWMATFESALTPYLIFEAMEPFIAFQKYCKTEGSMGGEVVFVPAHMLDLWEKRNAVKIIKDFDGNQEYLEALLDHFSTVEER